MDKNKIFKILISSFSRDLMDSFCLLVEANGSIATKITSYSELKPELKNSNADLALIDEFVLFEGRKTNSFDLIKNLKTHVPIILVSSQKITNVNHNLVYSIKKPISIGSLQSAIQTFTYMKQKDTKKEITKVGNVHYDAARRIIYYNDSELIANLVNCTLFLISNFPNILVMCVSTVLLLKFNFLAISELV